MRCALLLCLQSQSSIRHRPDWASSDSAYCAPFPNCIRSVLHHPNGPAMAQTLTIQMSRSNGQQPWGFRLQGGCDFASPLTVLRVNQLIDVYLIALITRIRLSTQVNIGSVSESAGLKAGDQILKVNQVDVLRLRHQEALDVISKAGNQFQLLIGRYISNYDVTCLHRDTRISQKKNVGLTEIADIFFPGWLPLLFFYTPKSEKKIEEFCRVRDIGAMF